jgi:DNA modification methylase
VESASDLAAGPLVGGFKAERMIQDEQLSELKRYRNLERRFVVAERPEFASLVIAEQNQELPVHRWFRFKEAYSASLLPTLLSSRGSSKRTTTILDPFCGVGTTLLSVQTSERNLSAIGIEHNPFIRFVASTKLDWHKVDPEAFLRIGEGCLEAPPTSPEDLPQLSSLSSGRCMSTYVARRLLGIRNAIKNEGSSATHRLLLLGLAATIESLSRTRKDGRALRLVERPRQIISSVILSKWLEIAKDISSMKTNAPNINPVTIKRGDGRKPCDSGIEPESIDLIITSPPYPNNIDYSEVYKLELWLMDFIRDSEKFLELRKGTFRSHPTGYFGDADEIERDATKPPFKQVCEPIAAKLTAKKDTWRKRLFYAYLSDLKSSLSQYYKILRKGGCAYIIVGNSLHGGKNQPYLIATDLMLAQLAEFAGFTVQEIAIARSLKRRLSGNHFLRESMVVLQK